MPVLEVFCETCNGRGDLWAGDGGKPCGECHGTGQRLTEQGRVMLLFMQRHMNMKAELRFTRI